MSPLRCFWSLLVEFVKTPESKTATKHAMNGGQRRSLSDGVLCSNDRRTTQGAAAAAAVESPIPLEEVERHDKPGDCWIVIKDKVYDVSRFGEVHPGGAVIFTQGGRNATDVFTSFHAASTWTLLKKFCIGRVATADDDDDGRSETLLEDFRRLRQRATKDGLFDTDWFFYVWKLALNASILISAFAVLVRANESVLAFFTAAFLLGLFFQQTGWLAHDFCHHQVFTDRKWNDLFGLVLGDVCQGFSMDWWKSKHNKHHAVTNEIDGNHLAVDPDIDTLPLLAWSPEMLNKLKKRSERTLIRYQHYLFLPILLFARFSWAQQSFAHALRNFLSGRKTKEFPLIVVHYIWHLGVPLYLLPTGQAVIFLCLCQAMSGFMLGFAFVQSHNGMEIYGDAKDFVTAQVISTRDISYSGFVDFFMGGLNYQIEHHLFPTMPRHNLKRAQALVKQLCEKHGLPYEECTMAVGTKRVLQRLVEVSMHA